MRSLVCIGECMIELNQSGSDAVAGEATAMSRTFGGDVLNTAVYAARHADRQCRVAFATALGQDPYSDTMLSAWQAEGLETDLVLRFADKLPGLYMIRTDPDGERHFHYWREQAAARSLFKHPDQDTLLTGLRGADMLYFSGISLAILDDEGRSTLLQSAETVRDAGGHVSFDTNYRPRLWADATTAAEWTERALATATIALPSVEDAAALSFGDTADQIIERFRALGIEETVVKDGPNPTTVAETGQLPVTLAQPVVQHPLDTTAAGDSFNGAYLACRLLGGSAEEAAKEGRAMAAWVVQHKGAIVPSVSGSSE